jgi:hypothetical protein
MKRLAFVVVLAAAAVIAALLATDVRGWHTAITRGDAAYATRPSRATWTPHTRIDDAAESILGTSDDLRQRRAVQSFVGASKLHLRLDNALEVEGARGGAQDRLETVARSHDPATASQALTLLGVLAFRSSASGGAQSQVDAALSDFTDAVRLDPRNENAAFNLELLLRLTAAHGRRVENGEGGGFGRSGRHGAAGGRSGSGY